MTLDEFLRLPHVGSVTVSIAANGLAFISASVKRGNYFEHDDLWHKDLDGGLQEMIRRHSGHDDEDLLV